MIVLYDGGIKRNATSKKSLKQFATENNKHKLLSHYSKDNPLTADEIGHNSIVKVKWTCGYGHTVIESPFNRVRRGGYCLICGKEECGYLAQRLPYLLKWWSLKNKVSPEEIPPHIFGTDYLAVWKQS